jgi:AcrR family transcriptional regulator
MIEASTSKGEQTRQAIMEAARAIILEQGYTAASMRKIADAVGITPAAIYNHFDGKEALFSTLLAQAMPLQEVETFLREVEGDTAEALLARGFRGLVALIAAHEDYIRLALIDAQERDGATLVTFLPTVFPLMMSFTQRLQALDAGRGHLRPVPSPVLARTLVSLIGGYLLTERIGRPQQTLNLPSIDWVGGLLDVLLYGVFVKPAEGNALQTETF